MAITYGTTSTFSGNANSLASGGFASLGVIDFTTLLAHEAFVEISMQANATPGGNKQVVIFARTSLDGTNYSVAPASGELANVRQIGLLSLPDTTARRSLAFPVAIHFASPPPKVEIYVQNDAGVALASTGQTGQYRSIVLG